MPAIAKTIDKQGNYKEYIKPIYCVISDEEWVQPLGYCWGFALNQDKNIPQKESCINCLTKNISYIGEKNT